MHTENRDRSRLLRTCLVPLFIFRRRALTCRLACVRVLRGVGVQLCGRAVGIATQISQLPFFRGAFMLVVESLAQLDMGNTVTAGAAAEAGDEGATR